MPDSKGKPILVWLRNDLRLKDNAALNAAVSKSDEVICFYILEDHESLRPIGGAARWWLDKSLKSLRSDISQRGGKLVCRSGNPADIIPKLVKETGAGGVYWGRRYGKAERDLDASIKSSLRDADIEAESFNTCLLTEPWSIETTTGGYYKVFTPYWKAVKAAYSPPAATEAPESLKGQGVDGDRIEDWDLHPTEPDWSTGFDDRWTPGEDGAAERLGNFLDSAIASYKSDRNNPAKENGTSGLSPHLRFGEISPAQVWRAVAAWLEQNPSAEDSAWTFLSEIVWREFSYVLLYHNPDLAWANYNKTFNDMPWKHKGADLSCWQKGMTGYPIVDAGMRELWTTGWMHNRVRMIVASFLTKHLLIHWRDGEDWFWDTLVDADPASNSASWQWTAGSGADAAPYFRVFNPITQGEKFDPDGKYVRKWCPELKSLPDKLIHSPWEASEDELSAAKVELGKTYPKPLIEHRQGRERALEAWKALKNKQDAA